MEGAVAPARGSSAKRGVGGPCQAAALRRSRLHAATALPIQGEGASRAPWSRMPELAQHPRLDDLLGRFGALTCHYQPIVDLTTGRPVAFEALARFSSGARPDQVFREARARGLHHALELAAVAQALSAGPPPGGARLAINVSPDV